VEAEYSIPAERNGDHYCRGKDSPYANVIAVRAADTNCPAVKALVKAANSKEVKKYIETELVPKGIVPAF